MSQIWSDRQRRTNMLVRKVAKHVLASNPDTDQIFGLCKLTWITSSYDGVNAAYIQSTKIPALIDALGLSRNLIKEKLTLTEVAYEAATIFNDSELQSLLLSHTGFTNFYKAYRNSARDWVDKNKPLLIEIFTKAYSLTSDQQGEELTSLIAQLPLIPKANKPNHGMQPEYLVTPVCLALDSRLRFPIMNGAARVRKILKHVKADDQIAALKYRALVNLIGRSGIRDAADLDQLDAIDQLQLGYEGHEPLVSLLDEYPENGDLLPSKDEEDVKRLQLALATGQRRIHNQMTNKLRRILPNWTLHEGRAADCKYDV